MNRRALAIAAFLAACCTALLMVYLKRFEQEMSGGDRVALLTLVKPVARGAVISDDMLATRRVPLAYLEDRAVKASDRAKVLGLEASTELTPQQTLLWTDLAITTEERDLSTLVRPGKRGVTVHAAGFNDAPGNALIHPGDYVDVLLTSVDSRDPKDQSTTVLLQRILVLAVGKETSGSLLASDQRNTASAAQEKLLTLSLSLADAQILALALEKGRLVVAVRNASDPAVQTDMPDVNAGMLFTGRARPEAPSAARGAPAGPIAIGGQQR